MLVVIIGFFPIVALSQARTRSQTRDQNVVSDYGIYNFFGALFSSFIIPKMKAFLPQKGHLNELVKWGKWGIPAILGVLSFNYEASADYISKVVGVQTS